MSYDRRTRFRIPSMKERVIVMVNERVLAVRPPTAMPRVRDMVNWAHAEWRRGKTALHIAEANVCEVRINRGSGFDPSKDVRMNLPMRGVHTIELSIG